MGWSSVDLANAPGISALKGINEGLTPLVKALTTIMEMVASVIDVTSARIVSLSDAETAALKSAIAAIRALLKDLTGNAGCYFLAVPLRNINITPRLPIWYAQDPSDPHAASDVLIPPNASTNGGNYGFLQDVINSINDTKDIMRPQFDKDAHIAGIMVVSGASSYLKIVPLVEKLVKLFSGNNGEGAGEGLADYSAPTPRELKTTIVPAAVGAREKAINRYAGDGNVHPYGVRLSWARDDRVTTITSFAVPVRMTIRNVLVYRSEYPILQGTTTTQLDEDEDVGQIGKFEYDGFNNEFFDDSIKLNTTYYYAVAYEFETQEGSEPIQEYVQLSPAITHVYIPENVTTLPRSGVPPDWLLLPSPLSLIPGMHSLITQVDQFLTVLEKRLDDKSTKLKKYVEALRREIRRYTRRAREVTTTIQQIIDLMTLPHLYIGAYTFAGKGGNRFLINTIGTALSDTRDANRPPFDRGDELVTGFILMAGSATAGKLTTFKKLLELLFQTPVNTQANATVTAIASINALIDTVEQQIALLDNLDKDPAGANVATAVTTVSAATHSAIGPNLELATEQNDGKECQS